MNTKWIFIYTIGWFNVQNDSRQVKKSTMDWIEQIILYDKSNDKSPIIRINKKEAIYNIRNYFFLNSWLRRRKCIRWGRNRIKIN